MSAFEYVRAIQLARTEGVSALLMAAGIVAKNENNLARGKMTPIHQRLDNALIEVQERLENHGISPTFDEMPRGSM